MWTKNSQLEHRTGERLKQIIELIRDTYEILEIKNYQLTKIILYYNLKHFTKKT